MTELLASATGCNGSWRLPPLHINEFAHTLWAEPVIIAMARRQTTVRIFASSCRLTTKLTCRRGGGAVGIVEPSCPAGQVQQLGSAMPSCTGPSRRLPGLLLPL